MKFKKLTISPQTTFYYVQKPDQRLVQLINHHFDFEMDHLPEQVDIKMIIKRSLARFLTYLYYELENEILDLIQFEKIIFLIQMISFSWNTCFKIKSVVFIQKRLG